MSYNVGPNYQRSHKGVSKCACCEEMVRPEWIGAFGHWECPECGDEMDVTEEASN